MVHILELPDEIIVLIFKYYLRTENQGNFIRNISRVCDDWKRLCYDSSLWIEFDGTVPFQIMKALCKNNSLQYTTNFIFSETECLKDDDAEKTLSRLTNVESIDLKNVKHFSTNFWAIVKENVSGLKGIAIGSDSGKSILKGYPKLPVRETVSFFTDYGKKLTSIRISNCILNNYRLILNTIASFCPNLETLQLDSLKNLVGSFPTVHFQECCPKLKTLYLDNSFEIKNHYHKNGFPELERFSFVVNPRSFSFSDGGFRAITENSKKLKFVHLASSDVSACVLAEISSSLEYLFLPKTKAVQERELIEVLKNCSFSLKQLDISHATNMVMNSAISALVSTTESKLEYLDLSYSSVLIATVEKILLNCKHLESLHLRGCRHLPRGMKSSYYGKTELNKLLEKVQDYISSNQDEEMVVLD